MNSLYTISSCQQALIEPLKRWRILCLENLLRLKDEQKITSCGYKRVNRLENLGLIEGAIDPRTKRKYIYLTRDGLAFFGLPKNYLMTGQTMAHDALASDILFCYRRFFMFKDVLTEVDLMEQYPMIGHRPDGAFIGEHNGNFLMAVELETSTKARNRVEEIFQFYSSSELFNNVLYIFSSRQTFELYNRILQEMGARVDQSKFLFVFSETMYKRWFDFWGQDAYWQGKRTTLKAVFNLDIPTGPVPFQQQGNGEEDNSNEFYRPPLIQLNH